MQDRFKAGQTFSSRLTVDSSTVARFADFSGDHNPIHVDEVVAREHGYARQVAHGAILVSLLSKMIGMEVPGPGAVWMSQTIEWPNPVFIGDDIAAEVTITSVSQGTGVLTLEVQAKNQREQVVMTGEAKVKMTEKLAADGAEDDEQPKVALVTGASGGIGAAIATRLAADGMQIAVHYSRSHEVAEQLVTQIRNHGAFARTCSADLANHRATAGMVQEVISRFGRLDIVVHAATPRIQPVDVADLTYDDVEAYLRVYLDGALSLLHHAKEGMAKRRFGRFIFLGTSAMLGEPAPRWAGYLIAKHALWGLVKSMAHELGPMGITTNMVSPSMTVTDLTSEVPARMKEVEARMNPMRRLATADDTAALVGFLSSDAAGFINGDNLPVTGGARR